MEERIALILLFCCESAYVLIGMLTLFGGMLRRKWILIMAGACYIGYICLTPLSVNDNMLDFFCFVGASLPYIISFFTIYSERPKYVGWLMGRLLILTYIDELLYMCINDILYLAKIDMGKNELNLFINILNLILLIIVTFIYTRYKNFFSELRFATIIKKSMIPMLAFFAFEIVGITIWLDLSLQNRNGENGYSLFGMVLGFLSMLSIGIFAIMVLFVKKSNEKMEQLLIAEKQIQQYQRDYYDTLLEKELETRKYRHDMKGHLVCLESLVYDRDIDGLANYIRKMNSYVEQIQHMAYRTEIRIFDILLNHYCMQLDENTRIEVFGECGYEIDVSEMEQCIIFSNLIKNAVESIGRMNHKPAILQIIVEAGTEAVNIRIENSINENKLRLNSVGKLRTSKTDEENHGFGVSNIMKVVKKNAGTFEYYIQNHQFVCEVSLPVKVHGEM